MNNPDVEDALGLFEDAVRQTARTIESSVVANFVLECRERLQGILMTGARRRGIATPDYVNGPGADFEPPVPGPFYEPDTDDLV